MTSSIEWLAPCPCCGARRELTVIDDPEAADWRVSCAGCQLTLRSPLGLQAVLERWNTRAPLAPEEHARR